MPGTPKIIFASGVGTVTGANFIFESATGNRILIDCGMVQGERTAQEVNREPFPYDISAIKALIITHAHLDHVGRIGKLIKDGYSGPIYSTPETKALGELVMRDAVGLLAKEARNEGKEPLYVMSHVDAALPLWKTFPYHESFQVTDDISAYFKDAGHILGSSMIEITSGDKKILFTGDLGNSPAPLLRDTEAVGDVDYMVMESVYGDRNHEARNERDQKFVDIVNAAMARGGTLVIPAFSLDRTQVLMYEMNQMVEQNRIPSVPIFIDTPMGSKATDVYRHSTELFNDAIREQIRKGDDIFKFPRLQYASSPQESEGLDYMKGAKIILAGSGMSVGGRVIGHEEHLLPDTRNTVLLVGYQSAGSLGRALAEGAKRVTIHGREIEVKAKIETLYEYSAHKDSDHLVEFVGTSTNRLKKVFVVMGEPKASMYLAQRINDELGKKALFPERLKEYEI